MTDEQATADALAPSEDMGALWDKLTAEGVEEAPKEEAPAEEAQDEAEAPAEGETDAAAEKEPEAEEKPAEPVAEAPGNIPQRLREKWASFSEEQRAALIETQGELGKRLAEQGRVIGAAKPIYDVVVEAARQLPTLKDMTPQQIARDVFEMAKVSDMLSRDPVNTILRVAKERGALDGLRQVLAGQQATDQTPALVNEIRSLRAQLAQVADPSALEQRVMETMTARETERVVTEYAASKEHWGAVEGLMPQMIAAAQSLLGESASAKDVLDRAYDMAIHAHPDLRAKVTAPQPAQPQPDPARTAAQLKAKSVNVVSRSTGQSKPLTERQALESAWDRLTQS